MTEPLTDEIILQQIERLKEELAAKQASINYLRRLLEVRAHVREEEAKGKR